MKSEGMKKINVQENPTMSDLPKALIDEESTARKMCRLWNITI